MDYTKQLVGLLGLMICLIQSYSQLKTSPLSLAEAIAKATLNNRAVNLSKLDEQIAAYNYKQTDAIYLPQIGLSYTAMSTNNPLNAFGFKLQQKAISQIDFNPDLLNHPNSTPDFTTKLEVLQPLINMDMWYMRKGAAMQTEIYQLKTKRTKEYITFQVQKAYLQLQLAYNAVKVLEDALQTTKAVYTFTDNHFKQGLIQKSDVLNVQVQINTVESNLAKAKSNIGNASDYLSLLMAQSTGIVYTTTDNDAMDTNTDSTVTIASNRSDFMAMQKAIDASDILIKSSKMSELPKLNAFGSYQLNDSKILGFGANAYLVGAQLSWDIFKGFKTKNTIATKTLERNKLAEELTQQKEQSNLELSKTKRDISDAVTEIATQKVAIAQAEESLRILQNRYEQGLVNTTDVLMANTQVSQQKFALAQAIFNLNVAKSYLQFLTTSTNK